MKEDYLQFIWSQKRFLSNEFITTNGENVVVIDFGVHNEKLDGPDFLFASVLMDDLIFYGTIEIHVNSSDWYQHNHDKNRAYDNVILHVVYNHDKNVIQNGREVPTIQIKNKIDFIHLRSFESRIIQHFICQKSVDFTSLNASLEEMKDISLSLKYNQFNLPSNTMEKDFLFSFLVFMSKAFGTNVNQNAFLQLFASINIENVKAMNCFEDVRQLILLKSQVDLPKEDALIHWNVKGVRPSNSPKVRVEQFAYVFARIVLSSNFKMKNCETILNEIIHDYNETSKSNLKLSSSFYQHLIINLICPTLYLFSSNKTVGIKLVKNKLKLLAQEKNYITRRWNSVGVVIKNAFDSQALLSLNKYYCSQKKCLSCMVGKKALET